MTALDEFYSDFLQDILAGAEADGTFTEDTFFDRFSAELVDAGELETADRAHFSGQRGVRVDGYGGDPATTGGTLSLLLLDFRPEPDVQTLTKSDLDAIFKRGANFISKSRDAAFRAQLEESSPAFGLADTIAARWDQIDRIRLLLMSNRLLSARVDGLADGAIDGRPLTQNLWDIERLWHYISSGQGLEEVMVELESDFGGGIPILSAHLDAAGYESYLAVIPGRQLAEIYDRWGARLLERNVRVFLQARGNVNKGIRNTIENEPEMFFAYNNGITATAEEIKTRQSGHGLLLTHIRNLQIVNGGQTTASIHAALRRKMPLTSVFVQMKLSIVGAAKAEEIVPRISEFANSQNRVNAADFFANHPYHVRMQEISRRLYAPSSDGALRGSKWFYERARGQYQDERGKLSKAAQKKFELEYPKKQVFTKTDLAKYLNVWECRPDIVSKGAQKNFAAFALFIGQRWEKNSDRFNENYYREAIAKAIVFREMERLVPQQPWYESGYRANIVAYAVAKVVHDAREASKYLDLGSVWKGQRLPRPLEDALVIAARSAHSVLTAPPPAQKNVTEWAKQQACWEQVARLEIKWPESFLASLVSGADQTIIEADAVRAQKADNSISAQTRVVSAGAELWRLVRAWGMSRSLLTEREQGILDVCGAVPDKIPTDKQCEVALRALKRLHEEGCRLGKELV
jgi:hypothetical protein